MPLIFTEHSKRDSGLSDRLRRHLQTSRTTASYDPSESHCEIRYRLIQITNRQSPQHSEDSHIIGVDVAHFCIEMYVTHKCLGYANV